MYTSQKRNALKSVISVDSAFDGENKHVGPRNSNLQIGLTSLVLGLGLTSALAMSVAGYGYRVAAANQGQVAIANTQFQADTVENRQDAFSLKRRNEIQTLSQLSLLSHEKIRASLSPGEQRQALTQYTAGYEGYESITFTDLQGNVVTPIQGKAGASTVSRALAEQSIAQRGIVDSGLAQDDGQAFQLVAPVMDAGTGQVIGTIEAVISAQLVRTQLEASVDGNIVEVGATEASSTIAFQLKENLAMVMALSLPIAMVLLSGLILFWDHHIHQALAVPPARLKSLTGMGNRGANL